MKNNKIVKDLLDVLERNKVISKKEHKKIWDEYKKNDKML
jgi:hypothetical protein